MSRGAALLPLCVLLVAPLRAQDQALPLAEGLLAVLAPAVDDPAQAPQQLLAQALAAPRSPVAGVLCAEALARLDDLADPAQFARWLAEHAPAAPVHGLVQDPLRAIAFRLGRLGAAAAVKDPFPDHARAVVVVGPFGDAGRNALDVPFAPDAAFPALGTTLPGRCGDVAPRVVAREAGRDDFALPPPGLRRPGCYYVLWRVHAAAASAGFVEVDLRAPFVCRVDGVEVGRSLYALDAHGPLQRLPVRLQPGEHQIVVKSGDEGEAPLSLRLVDGSGLPLPQVTEVAPDAAPAPLCADDPRDHGAFKDGLATLLQAAAAADGKDRATLRVAAAWSAGRLGETDTALDLLQQLQQEPPPLPAARFVLADLWLRAAHVPDELRTARARAHEAEAMGAVPKTHHRAVLAQVRASEDQDRREDALRLLRAEIDAGRAGPSTFAATHAVLRRLAFLAEEEPLLQRWAKQCPADTRPLVLLADRQRERGDARGAWVLLQQVFARHPFDDAVRRRAFDLALDLGEFDPARAVVDRGWPPDGGTAERMRRRLALATLAARAGDADGERSLLREIMADPATDARTLAQCADRWLRLGDDAQALAATAASLQREADQPTLRELRARLHDGTRPGADFERFRRDGDAAIAAFQPGPGERDASSTMLIDQRIVELQPDGSSLVEVHELRRLNDLQGVEAWHSASDPAQADELLLVRTVSKDGRSYVPTRVQGDFALPRLEPGAFVEWRYRRRTPAAQAQPWRVEDFLFASHQEPLRVTEWVLIVPDGGKGSLRTRNLDVAPRREVLPGGRTAWIITRQDVARLPEEDSPPPAEELLPMAGYGEDASPFPTLRQRRAQWLAVTRPTPPVAAFAATLLQGASTDRDRLQRIHAFCQDEIADGEGNDATEALLRKKGNRFMLEVALLRAAAVPVEAAACERARRALTGDGVPLFAEDDATPTLAALAQPRDGSASWLFSDTPRYWPLGAVPAHRQGALAYVAAALAAVQQRLPSDDASPRAVAIDGQCTVGERTALHARVRIGDFTGYGLAEQLRRRTADVQKLAARQIGQQVLGDWRIQGAAPVGLEPGGAPLQLELDLQRPAPQEAAAGRWLLPLPFPAADLRKTLGDRDERTLPLRQNQDLEMRTHVVVDPGDGRCVPVLPEPLFVSFALLDYQLTFARDGSRVVVDRLLRVRPGTIEVALYADWIRWLAAIDHREQERLELAVSAPAAAK